MKGKGKGGYMQAWWSDGWDDLVSVQYGAASDARWRDRIADLAPDCELDRPGNVWHSYVTHPSGVSNRYFDDGWGLLERARPWVLHEASRRIRFSHEERAWEQTGSADEERDIQMLCGSAIREEMRYGVRGPGGGAFASAAAYDLVGGFKSGRWGAQGYRDPDSSWDDTVKDIAIRANPLLGGRGGHRDVHVTGQGAFQDRASRTRAANSLDNAKDFRWDRWMR